MESRSQAPSRYVPLLSCTACAFRETVFPFRSTCSFMAAPAAVRTAACTSSTVSTSFPFSVSMMSPVFRPQRLAGEARPLCVSISARPTTSTPSEKSLIPTARPEGTTTFLPRDTQGCALSAFHAAPAPTGNRTATVSSTAKNRIPAVSSPPAVCRFFFSFFIVSPLPKKSKPEARLDAFLLRDFNMRVLSAKNSRRFCQRNTPLEWAAFPVPAKARLYPAGHIWKQNWKCIEKNKPPSVQRGWGLLLLLGFCHVVNLCFLRSDDAEKRGRLLPLQYLHDTIGLLGSHLDLLIT